MDLVKVIKATVTKINNLEKNKRSNNAEIIEVEIEGERNKLNEYFKIAKAEGLKGQIQFLAAEGRR